MENVSLTTLKSCEITPLHAFSKGMTVYKQGETGKAFYYLNSGLIGLYHALDNGKESLIRLYQKGDFFGYRTMFGDNQYHCSAKVLMESDIIRIKPQNPHTFLIENPDISEQLLKNIAIELREAEKRLAKNTYLRTLDRIIDSIYYLKHTFPDYNWTHREIAEYAGCETETAIRIAKELKRNGLLTDK